MPWPVGTAVVVRTLGNRRGTIAHADANGRYRVRVEGVSISCREQDLKAADQPDKSRSAARRKSQREPRPAPEPTEHRHGGRLDLHGFRVEEALARVDEEINRALLRGEDRLEIVHGLGTGRIKNALHRHLASMTVVAAFRLDSRNPGVTWVHF